VLMPTSWCCVALYRDEHSRKEGYHRYDERRKQNKPHLGLVLSAYPDNNDPVHHPTQGSYRGDHFVIFPIKGPERLSQHEPDLLDSHVVNIPAYEAWHIMTHQGKEGLKTLLAA
jgi:hypothetical protein